MTGLSPNMIAFCAPATAKNDSPDRIEQKHRRAQPVNAGIQEEGDDSGKYRNQQISPVGQGGRRHRADQHVARNPAEIPRDKRQNENAEDIQSAINRGDCSTDRENEGATQIKNANEGLDRDHTHPVEDLAVEPKAVGAGKPNGYAETSARARKQCNPTAWDPLASASHEATPAPRQPAPPLRFPAWDARPVRISGCG